MNIKFAVWCTNLKKKKNKLYSNPRVMTVNIISLTTMNFETTRQNAAKLSKIAAYNSEKNVYLVGKTGTCNR